MDCLEGKLSGPRCRPCRSTADGPVAIDVTTDRRVPGETAADVAGGRACAGIGQRT
ncbi:hypothetical protein BURPSPAST_X0033 [Burkholderia pseudomallei Pasteur 52237]|nr:hypothetical protein BURPSPAST_X0033 [Burkholderia pseudomallei Pasteur 52237]EDU06775.1 hypothetical protein BURPS1655_B0029 [Burkholderia pseudomallei 1655]EEC33726.1 hypothetical protein BUC_4181 [Burkholderia pseudomallei 576]